MVAKIRSLWLLYSSAGQYSVRIPRLKIEEIKVAVVRSSKYKSEEVIRTITLCETLASTSPDP